MGLLRRASGRVRYSWLRRRLDPRFASELYFWEGYISRKGGDWSFDWSRRMDPDATLGEPLIEERLGRVPDKEIEILDVGAGPTTSLGKTAPGRRIRIVGTDPLAREYRALLDRAGVSPPAPAVVAASAEKVAERFPAGSFSIAYSRNALDHAEDPGLAIAGMARLLRPGGFLILRHYANAGVEEGYQGLHRWNFEIRNDELIVWRPGHEIHVGDLLGSTARQEQLEVDEYSSVVAVYRKTEG